MKALQACMPVMHVVWVHLSKGCRHLQSRICDGSPVAVKHGLKLGAVHGLLKVACKVAPAARALLTSPIIWLPLGPFQLQQMQGDSRNMTIPNWSASMKPGNVSGIAITALQIQCVPHANAAERIGRLLEQAQQTNDDSVPTPDGRDRMHACMHRRPGTCLQLCQRCCLLLPGLLVPGEPRWDLPGFTFPPAAPGGRSLRRAAAAAGCCSAAPQAGLLRRAFAVPPQAVSHPEAAQQAAAAPVQGRAGVPGAMACGCCGWPPGQVGQEHTPKHRYKWNCYVCLQYGARSRAW